MKDQQIEFTTDETFYQTLEDSLGEYNLFEIGRFEVEKIGFRIVDENEKIIAGLWAVIYYEVMVIDLLWVDESMRGQGLGKALVEKAEGAAREQHCRCIHLSSFDFQAPEFYERLGYERIGEIGPYPNNHVRVYLSKVLKYGEEHSCLPFCS